jgi:hypothetical protein
MTRQEEKYKRQTYTLVPRFPLQKGRLESINTTPSNIPHSQRPQSEQVHLFLSGRDPCNPNSSTLTSTPSFLPGPTPVSARTLLEPLTLSSHAFCTAPQYRSASSCSRICAQCALFSNTSTNTGVPRVSASRACSSTVFQSISLSALEKRYARGAVVFQSCLSLRASFVLALRSLGSSTSSRSPT